MRWVGMLLIAVLIAIGIVWYRENAQTTKVIQVVNDDLAAITTLRDTVEARKLASDREFDQALINGLATLETRRTGRVVKPVLLPHYDFASRYYRELRELFGSTVGVQVYRGGRTTGHKECAALSTGAPLCSSAIIAPNAFLTAAHCFDPPPPREIKIGATVAQPNNQPITISLAGAEWQNASAIGLKDALLVILPTDALSVAGSDTPLFASPSLIDSAKKFTVVGFGASKANGTGIGWKREGTVLIESARCSDPTRQKALDCMDKELIAGGHPLDQGVCESDSGAPIYVDAGGVLLLAGITEHYAPASQTCAAAFNVYARADEIKKWIDDPETKKKFTNQVHWSTALTVNVSYAAPKVAP